MVDQSDYSSDEYLYVGIGTQGGLLSEHEISFHLNEDLIDAIYSIGDHEVGGNKAVSLLGTCLEKHLRDAGSTKIRLKCHFTVEEESPPVYNTDALFSAGLNNDNWTRRWARRASAPNVMQQDSSASQDEEELASEEEYRVTLMEGGAARSTRPFHFTSFRRSDPANQAPLDVIHEDEVSETASIIDSISMVS